jgi:hypothetical protein
MKQENIHERFLLACKKLGDNNAEISRITQLHTYGIGVSRSAISYLKKGRGKPHTLALVTFVLEFHLNQVDST